MINQAKTVSEVELRIQLQAFLSWSGGYLPDEVEIDQVRFYCDEYELTSVMTATFIDIYHKNADPSVAAIVEDERIRP